MIISALSSRPAVIGQATGRFARSYFYYLCIFADDYHKLLLNVPFTFIVVFYVKRCKYWRFLACEYLRDD